MRINPTGAFSRVFGSGARLLSHLALAELKRGHKAAAVGALGETAICLAASHSLPGLCLDSSPFFFLLEWICLCSCLGSVVPHPSSYIGTQHPSTGMAPADLKLER